MRKLTLITLLNILLLANCNLPEIPDLGIKKCTVEYIENPLGIDVKTPRFTWAFTASTRNQFQSDYRLLVSSTKEMLDSNIGDLWDSGKINSGQSLNIEYDGTPLESFKRYYWNVMVNVNVEIWAGN